MRTVIRGVLILSAAGAAAVACSSTDVPDPDPQPSGGSAGTSTTGGNAGQNATGGKGGSSAGNTGTTGGTAGTGTGGTPGAGTGGVMTAGTGGAVTAGTGGTTGGTMDPSGGTGGMAGGPAGSGGDAGSGTSGAGQGGMSGSGGSAPGGGFVTCPYTPPADPTGADFAAGEVTLFNNNGAWTWYTDERVIVDKAGGKIIVGSDANAQGAMGSGRDGTVEAVIYDVATSTASAVHRLGDLAPDDHNNAAFVVKPDGNYLAFWAGHNENCNSYWSNHDGSNWANQSTFGWSSQGCPWTVNGQQRSITYNNLWNMTAENKIYNFVRSVDTSPNLLVSTNNGMSWSYGGRLTSTNAVGYVAGYYKYWGNGVDRIDFFATEAHPRDNDNNLWHGYVSGGKSYDSAGTEQDGNISDGQAPNINEFTRVFQTGSNIAGQTMHHAWNSDVVRYADGTVAAIGMARTSTDSNNPDHAFLYFRYDGMSWSTTYLGKAGKKLYDSEQDYVGLGALHPNDKRVIYISAEHDPRDGEDLLGDVHEIFMGVTCDEGETFQWTPVTWNSTKDNLRPVVPDWDENNMVLVWFRGSYSTAQIYNEEVVGIITQNP